MLVVQVHGLSAKVPGRQLLRNINLELHSGDFLALMGSSGSGKTTMLNCLSGIQANYSGQVVVQGEEFSGLSAAGRARKRLTDIGLIFQFGELLPELSVEENVALPARLSGQSAVKALQRARDLLSELGLGDRTAGAPRELSGGEVQRVAIARALINDPVLVLADEPTGALDEHTSLDVIELLLNAARSRGAAVLIATHDPLVAGRVDRVVHLVNGALESRSAMAVER